jgi:hypothetical protein
MTIYEIENWSELFNRYEQLNSIKLCQTCWGDKIKVFNFFKTMAKKNLNSPENSATFKAEFEGCEVRIKGVDFVITKDNLTSEIVEKYFKDEPSLMALLNEQ